MKMNTCKGLAHGAIVLLALISVAASEFAVHEEACSPHEHHCKEGEAFHEGTCSCKPIISPIPTCYHVQECSGHQIFDLESCQCRCPSDAASYCNAYQILDPRTCQCICRNNENACNKLQEFDPDTCVCRCTAVIPADDDDDETTRTGTTRTGTSRTGTSRTGTSRSGTSRSGTSRSGTSRSGTSRSGTSRSGTSRTGTTTGGTTRGTTRTDTTGTSRRKAFNVLPHHPKLLRPKRSRSRSRSRSSSRSRSTSRSSTTRSTTTGTDQQTPLLSRCPGGQYLDIDTCQCFF